MTKTQKRLWVTWLIAIVVIVISDQGAALLSRFDLSFPPLGVIEFCGWLVLLSLTLYFIAIGIRFLMRRLFWRVGRRLFLSYVMIGGLPFLFFAILLIITGYIAAGVLSQAAYRTERQGALSRLDQSNLEYALTGSRPAGTFATLEVYDSRDRSTDKLPEWLRKGTFVGLAEREKKALFISSRSFEQQGKERRVVFVQPVDEHWVSYLDQKYGMYIAQTVTSAEHTNRGNISIGNTPMNADESQNVEIDDDFVEKFFKNAWRRRGVIWVDPSPILFDWDQGNAEGGRRLLTFFSNPWSNLVSYYFVDSNYAEALIGVIVAIATMLAFVYMLASLLAGGLIYSISRAVNRIDRGAKAVERGDFSYRIGLKPMNQLGEVAQSFDRMTESIGSLLTKVAGQERLQSEIDIAASIQRNLLPKEGPHQRGVSFSAHFEPSAAIGGDYYDVFSLDRSTLAVAIGDVSGHGLSTGLVMAMVKAAITTLVEEGTDEVAIFRRLNELVIRSTDKRAFMTLAFTTFDLEKGIIRHTNAGHLYPYLLRQGARPHPIEVPSLPLGLKPEIQTKTVELDLREKDTLVYLSDGIIEAQNPGGDPFGFEQLEDILSSMSSDTPAAIQAAILEAVEKHSGSRPADDDRTVMVLRFDHISAAQRSLDPLDEEYAPMA